MTSTHNAETLLPCPFCGSDKINVERDHSQGAGVFACMACQNCRTKTRETYYSNGNDCPQTYQGLRDAWNTRALPVQKHDADTVERVAEDIYLAEMEYGDTEMEGQYPEWGHLTDRCKSSRIHLARAALSALPPQEVSVQEAARVLLGERVKADHVEAAMVGHYGEGQRSLTIHGVDLTVNGKNWSFNDGFKRMLKAYLRALSEKPQ